MTKVFWVLLFDLLQQTETIKTCHAQIGKHKVIFLTRQQTQRFVAILCDSDLVSFFAQQGP